MSVVTYTFAVHKHCIFKTTCACLKAKEPHLDGHVEGTEDGVCNAADMAGSLSPQAHLKAHRQLMQPALLLVGISLGAERFMAIKSSIV